MNKICKKRMPVAYIRLMNAKQLKQCFLPTGKSKSRLSKA